MANKNTQNKGNGKPEGLKTKSTAPAKKQIGATIAAGSAARTSKTIIIVSIIASVALVLLSILGIFAVSGEIAYSLLINSIKRNKLSQSKSQQIYFLSRRLL